METIKRRVFLQGTAAAASAWLLSGRETLADADVRTQLKAVAQSISKFLEKEGEEAIAIGQFSSPPQLAATGGLGIVQVLSEELAALKIAVKRRAKLGLQGAFRPDSDPMSQRPAARVDVTIVNDVGAELIAFTHYISESKDVAALLGLTVALDPNLPQKAHDEQLAQSITTPGGALQQHTLRAAPDSPYGVEIWVKGADDYEPRALSLDEGLAFVQLQKADLYAIRIINDSPHDAAVSISIDGVNLFAFSEHKGYSNLILTKEKQSALVKGWFRTLEKSDAFKITGYAESAAAELLQDSSQIGTITAAFAACWPKDQPPPSDELKFKFASRGAGDLATGRGPSISQKYEEAVRMIGEPRAVLSVRYSK